MPAVVSMLTGTSQRSSSSGVDVILPSVAKKLCHPLCRCDKCQEV